MSSRKLSNSTLIAIIKEINEKIGFNPIIDVRANNLEKEMRVSAKDLLAVDEQLLSVKTWRLLREGKFIDHIPQKAVQPAQKNSLKQIVHVAESLNKVLNDPGDADQIIISKDNKLMFCAIQEKARELFEEDMQIIDKDVWGYLEENGLVNHLLTEEHLEKLKDVIQENQKKWDTPKKKNAVGKKDVPSKSDSVEKPDPSKKKKLKRNTKKPNQERIDRIEELIQEGKHTNQAIAFIIGEEFPMFALSGTLAIISNSKSEKRTKFSKLVATDTTTKILSFVQ